MYLVVITFSVIKFAKTLLCVAYNMDTAERQEMVTAMVRTRCPLQKTLLPSLLLFNPLPLLTARHSALRILLTIVTRIPVWLLISEAGHHVLPINSSSNVLILCLRSPFATNGVSQKLCVTRSAKSQALLCAAVTRDSIWSKNGRTAGKDYYQFWLSINGW